MNTLSLVVPISFGNFVNQIAAYLLLHREGLRPDIIYSASGGSIATLILCSANTDNHPDDFEKNIFNLTDMVGPNNTFKDHPWSINILNPLFRYLNIPGIYEHGDPLPTSFYKYTTECYPEVWIATHCYKDKTDVLWTNKQNTIVEPHINIKKEYFNGNETFESVVRAASAIPTHSLPVKIEGKEFLDAGTKISSPFEYFIGNYRQRVPYKLVYLAPMYIDHNYPFQIYPTLNIVGKIIEKITYDRIYEELYLHRLLFKRLSNDKNVKSNKGDLKKDIKNIVNNLNNSAISLLIIYPIQQDGISPLYFKKGDVTRKIQESKLKTFDYEHLYVLK
jgi:hypothetical protein